MATTYEDFVCLQGHDNDDFINQNIDFLNCGICMGILRKTHQCSNGHCFCWACWQLTFQNKTQCPVCKALVDRNHLSRNLVVDQVIEKLDVKCYGRDSNDEHCKWIGKLENREKHILECEFLKEVECPFYHNGLCISQCNGKINRSSILSHIETCTDSIVIDADKLQRLLTSITGGFYRFRCYRQFKYVGDIKNGLKHGQGLLKSMDGKSHYDGEWLNDKRHGFGMQSFSEWSYRGDWFEDTMHGNCVCATCPAGTYMGHYQNNQPNGHGVFVSVTDSVHSVYTGEWLNGERCGKGSLVWHQNHHYHGDFQNDQFNGQGVLRLINGDVYVGHFKNGMYHGQGKLTKIDGLIYCGTFMMGEYYSHERLNFNDTSMFAEEFFVAIKSENVAKFRN